MSEPKISNLVAHLYVSDAVFHCMVENHANEKNHKPYDQVEEGITN